MGCITVVKMLESAMYEVTGGGKRSSLGVP